jgi:hypothetical protein
MFHLQTSGLSGMVFEHFRNCFDLEDLASNFIEFHQLCSHMVVGCIFGYVARVFQANQFLALVKLFGAICMFVVGTTFY